MIVELPLLTADAMTAGEDRSCLIAVRVLFVDDEASMRQAITQWLGLAGFDLVAHDNAASRDRPSEPRIFAASLVTDLKMEGMDGMALLRQSQEIDPELPVVMITGHGDIETAVEAMRLGAYDFIEKPFAPERLLEIVRRASEKRQLVLENRRLRRAVNEQTLASRIIGNSRAAETLRAQVAELAGTDVSVILYGETGTGKDLVARCLHDFGRRRRATTSRSIAPRCPRRWSRASSSATRPARSPARRRARAGKIEHANGGTLFLDEIDSMPLGDAGQAAARAAGALGRAARLEPQHRGRFARRSRRARSTCARRATSGKFRLDLYYRLSVVELTVPPLRERRDDIPLLFEYFAALAAQHAWARAAAGVGRDRRRA